MKNGSTPERHFAVVDDRVALNPRLTPIEKTVYMVLSCHRNYQTSQTFVGHETIGRETGLHRNTISRAIKRLVDKGFVTIERRRTSTGFGGNLYTLVLEVPNTYAPLEVHTNAPLEVHSNAPLEVHDRETINQEEEDREIDTEEDLLEDDYVEEDQISYTTEESEMKLVALLTRTGEMR